MTEEEYEAEFNRALQLRDAGAFEEAVQVFTGLLGSGFRRAAVHGMLGGIIHYDLKDPVTALPILRKSVALSPHSELASLGLFHALFALDRVDEAFDEMRRYVKDHESEEYDELLRDLKSAEVEEEARSR